MKWPALTAAMLCLGIPALAGGCGGSEDGARQEPGTAAKQEPNEAAGQTPGKAVGQKPKKAAGEDGEILDKPEYRVRLKQANEAYDRRLAKLSQGLDKTSRKDQVKVYRGFGDSLEQLSDDLDGFRPRDENAADAHQKLIEAFAAEVAFVGATDDTVAKNGARAIQRGPLKQKADMLASNLQEATRALVKSGWAPKGLVFDA